MKSLAVLVASLLAVGSLQAADWPQFRGPTRDGICAEKGLLAKWPEGGPKKLWTSNETGTGWSSIAVVKDTLYTTGVFGDDYAVLSLDAKGKLRWKKVLGKATDGGAAMGGYKGARGTPTVDGDSLYVVTDSGVLCCLKTADGKEVWSVDLAQKYAAKPPMWFYAESPLINGNAVICSPGGKAALVALDKKTGKEIWVTPAKQVAPAYASAVLLDLGGTKQIVSFCATAVFGADAATGKALWSQPLHHPYGVSATSAVAANGMVFCTVGYVGCMGVKVEADGKSSIAWKLDAPDDGFGGVVLVNGVVIASGYSKGGFYGVELQSGKVVFNVKTLGTSASLICADGHVIAQGYTGTVYLIDPADGHVVSSMKMPYEGKTMWAHPAVSNGRLYVRYQSSLACFDIKAP